MKAVLNFILIFAFFFAPGLVAAQGLVVNEVSNGPAGTQEFIEMVAVGATGVSCSTIDLRGWIIDDNNGDFACGPIAASGIASGHMRFRTTGPWGSIPLGSIVVVYNAADRNPLLPADDPYDSNADSVYIIPSSNTDIEVSNGTSACPGGTLIPMGCGTCGGTGNSAYSPATYVFGGSWNNVGLRNAGDAAQTRNPSGTYFHGVSWGTAGNNMAGGPDGLNVLAADGGTKTFYFNSGDFRTVANFSSGAAPALETPGAANNAANDTWIDSWRCTTTLLPMELVNFNVWAQTHSIALHWETLREINTELFLIERMDNENGKFIQVGKTKAAENSTTLRHYDFIDHSPAMGNATYRISLLDQDGSWSHSEMKKVNFYPPAYISVFPIPSEGLIHFSSVHRAEGAIHIFDVMGQKKTEIKFNENEITLDASEWPEGLYFYSFQESNGASNIGRFLIAR